MFSAAGATARLAVIVQTGCGFLSGGRRNGTPDDKEECFGRATVALTRAIQHTVDMASWNGSDVGSIPYRVLHPAAWPYGAMLVPDAAAILEWGFDDPFIPQDPSTFHCHAHN